jgi:hypothetical protein
MTPRRPIGVWRGGGFSEGVLPESYWSSGSHIGPPAARLRTFFIAIRIRVKKLIQIELQKKDLASGCMDSSTCTDGRLMGGCHL